MHNDTYTITYVYSNCNKLIVLELMAQWPGGSDKSWKKVDGWGQIKGGGINIVSNWGMGKVGKCGVGKIKGWQHVGSNVFHRVNEIHIIWLTRLCVYNVNGIK